MQHTDMSHNTHIHVTLGLAVAPVLLGGPLTTAGNSRWAVGSSDTQEETEAIDSFDNDVLRVKIKCTSLVSKNYQMVFGTIYFFGLNPTTRYMY